MVEQSVQLGAAQEVHSPKDPNKASSRGKKCFVALSGACREDKVLSRSASSFEVLEALMFWTGAEVNVGLMNFLLHSARVGPTAKPACRFGWRRLPFLVGDPPAQPSSLVTRRQVSLPHFMMPGSRVDPPTSPASGGLQRCQEPPVSRLLSASRHPAREYTVLSCRSYQDTGQPLSHCKAGKVPPVPGHFPQGLPSCCPPPGSSSSLAQEPKSPNSVFKDQISSFETGGWAQRCRVLEDAKEQRRRESVAQGTDAGKLF